MFSLLRRVSIAACVVVFAIASSSSLVSARRHHHHHDGVGAVEYTPAALADQITNLPGLAAQPTFNQFSGYLIVNATTQKSIFYWYTESQNDPINDPLLWWSNGGPGCSSVLGLLTEHGPFRLSNGGLVPFSFAFNTLANTLYVDAPAGTGFSYSNDTNDYTTGDAQTATDNFVAIQQFYIRFPHMITNELYIASESYGGHYIPTLALVIVSNNQNIDRPYPALNFKGFMLGNPLTDVQERQDWGMAGTFCGHSLASKPSCDAFKQACLGAAGPDASCNDKANAVAQEAGGLDGYGLNYPTCDAKSIERKHTLRHIMRSAQSSSPDSFSPLIAKQLASVPDFDPCGNAESTAYLNRADVRAALHVAPQVGQWVPCTTVLNYSLADAYAPMEPLYTQLIAAGAGLRMVIFSGDDDSVCATLGTQHWMFNLFGTTVTSAWNTWLYNSEAYGSQIGGYVVKFRDISLVTVHAAGHTVSLYQPERGLAVLANFLSGEYSNVEGEEKSEESRVASE